MNEEAHTMFLHFVKPQIIFWKNECWVLKYFVLFKFFNSAVLSLGCLFLGTFWRMDTKKQIMNQKKVRNGSLKVNASVQTFVYIDQGSLFT